MLRPALPILGVLAALGVALLVLLPTIASGGASPYSGSKQCQACHLGQHEAWETMNHSRAFESLRPEDVAGGKDAQGRACVQCHVTAYGKPDGFVSAEKTPMLAGVGCEACHGPGRVHIDTMIKAKLEEREVEDKKILLSVRCDTCHNPHLSYRKMYGSR